MKTCIFRGINVRFLVKRFGGTCAKKRLATCIAAAALALLGASRPTHAAPVVVNVQTNDFEFQNGQVVNPYTGQGALITGDAHDWNVYPNDNPPRTFTGLVDSSGAPSSVTFFTPGTGLYTNSAADTGNFLLDGCLATGPGASAVPFTIGGLAPNSTYDLYLYGRSVAGNAQSFGGSFDITSGGTGVNPNPQSDNGGIGPSDYTSSSISTTALGKAYVNYHLLISNNSGQITGTYLQSFNGFQIQGPFGTVPEPASLGVLGIAAIAALRRRRFGRESTRPAGPMRVTPLCALCVVGSVSLVASVASVAPVQAVPISIGDAGFESPAYAEGAFGVVDAWTTSTPGITNGVHFGAYNPGTADYPGGAAPEGQGVGWIYNDWGLAEGEMNMQQTLSAVLTAGTHYTLTVDVGNPLTYPGDNYYEVELLAGSTLLALDESTLTIPKGTFRTSTVTYDATASDPALGQPLTISLVNYPTPDAVEIDFDNVRLDATAVPEPATLATLPLLAGASLSRRLRRR
jgi:hypothetical protein